MASIYHPTISEIQVGDTVELGGGGFLHVLENRGVAVVGMEGNDEIVTSDIYRLIHGGRPTPTFNPYF